jgi:putative Holliday junction resolvase
VSAGRLLGVDYGTARVGLAVSDADRTIASPLTTYQRQTPARDAEFFRTLAREQEVVALVVGLPVHGDGSEGIKAAEARAFGAWLAALTGLPAVHFDERFTTVQAEAALWEAGLTHRRRKERRDRVAAQMLLQAYLDAGCPDEPEVGPLEG